MNNLYERVVNALDANPNYPQGVPETEFHIERYGFISFQKSAPLSADKSSKPYVTIRFKAEIDKERLGQGKTLDTIEIIIKPTDDIRGIVGYQVKRGRNEPYQVNELLTSQRNHKNRQATYKYGELVLKIIKNLR